jgi:1-acyl-sn-glycerol-3-phosphate acyltransferase
MLSNFVATIIRTLCGTKVRCEAIVDISAQTIFFANHQSMLDFIVIWSALPESMRAHVRPVAAAEYWLAGPLRKFLALTVFNAILVERNSANPEKAFSDMKDALLSGSSLIIFPEGTRNTSSELLPFKSGLYYLYREFTSVKFIPVYLENLNRILPKGEIIPIPVLSTLVIGSALTESYTIDKEEFLESARKKVISLGIPYEFH